MPEGRKGQAGEQTGRAGQEGEKALPNADVAKGVEPQAATSAARVAGHCRSKSEERTWRRDQRSGGGGGGEGEGEGEGEREG